MHHGAATFGFLPYFAYGVAFFAYGVALYHVVVTSERREQATGRKTAFVVIELSVLGMLWHFLSIPRENITYGFTRAVEAQAVILVGLILAFTVLARLHVVSWFQRLDNRIGSITYPL
jgi:hypothetical protein